MSDTNSSSAAQTPLPLAQRQQQQQQQQQEDDDVDAIESASTMMAEEAMNTIKRRPSRPAPPVPVKEQFER